MDDKGKTTLTECKETVVINWSTGPTEITKEELDRFYALYGKPNFEYEILGRCAA